MSFLSKMQNSFGGSGGASSSLPPAPHAIGVCPEFTAHRTETVLKLTESRLSWTGDDFKIKDASGAPLIDCEAKAMSVHGRKIFKDERTRKALFEVTKRPFHLHTTFYGSAPGDDDNKLFEVQKKMSLGAKLVVTFRNVAGDGKELELLVKGDFFDRNAEFTWNGVPVARISRSFFNMREAFSDKQTYYLSVAPGVDAALCAAICIILDEIKNDQPN